MRKLSLLSVFLIFSGLTTFAQTGHKFLVESILLDSIENTAVSYANIGISGKNIGTVSNIDGLFDLSIPDSLTDEKTSISRLYPIIRIRHILD